MPRRARFPVQVDRDLGVLEADLADERTQAFERGLRVLRGAGAELLVVDRQDKCRGPALLLRVLRQIVVARYAEDFQGFLLDRGCQGTDAEPRGIFRAKVLVNDDDGKAKFHRSNPASGDGRRLRPAAPAPSRHRTRQGRKARIMRRIVEEGYRRRGTAYRGHGGRVAGAGRHPSCAQILGSVTPAWPWYFPPRSL